MGDGIADAIHHRDGVGVAALLHHGQVDGTLAIYADDVVLDLLGVLGWPISDMRTGDSRHYLERIRLVSWMDRAGCWCKCCSRGCRSARLRRGESGWTGSSTAPHPWG